MKSPVTTSPYRTKVGDSRAWTYGILTVCAILFVWITARDDHLLASSGGTDHFFMANVSYIVLEVAVWFIAARAALRLKAYSRSVGSSSDGHALGYIANALLLLVPYSVLISIGTNAKVLSLDSPNQHVVTVLSNHLPLPIILAAAIYLYLGSRQLARLVPPESKRARQYRIVTLALFGLLVIVFARYFYAVAPSILDDDGLAHFSLSASAMMFTYVAPYIVVWLLGVLACLDLIHYRHQVKGAIYQQLFAHLYVGLLVVLSCTFIVQIILASQISTRQFSLQLLPIFGVILLLIVGYAQIYNGVDQLNRLEQP